MTAKQLEIALAAGDAGTWNPTLPTPQRVTRTERAANSVTAVECAHPGCAGGWNQRWKRRTRPFFEGGWACSPACLRAMVTKTVRREFGALTDGEHEPSYRHRVPLGLVLLAQGLITDPQLREALDAQRAAGRGRIGDWLQQACHVPNERITRGLGLQWGCPVLDTRLADPAAMALALPTVLRERSGLLPLRVAGQRVLYAAFQEQVNPAATLALEAMTGMRVESGLLTAEQFSRHEADLRDARQVPCREMQVRSQAEAIDAVADTVQRAQPVHSRLVRVHEYLWLRTWLERGALDSGRRVPSEAGRAVTLPRSSEDVQDLLLCLNSQHGA